ncbi:tRNA dihydrouridine synthase DusB [Gleimia hominis]|uniref:tRNA dihydrouridine synthase DusB n=1 Tax=Gleimia hominis TaxID=595468 RepID=UPI0035E4481E
MVHEASTGALKIGPIELWAPVLLSPMAGVTDQPFRRLCREFGEAGLSQDLQTQLPAAHAHVDAPAGLYVCEMITARALVEDNAKTRQMVAPDPRERVRSVQLYGTDPHVLEQATRILVQNAWADHIDLNFGCPVPKVTRKGGGAALPWKLDLFTDIVRAVRAGVKQVGRDVPVTVKLRIGIDSEHTTFRDAAQIAQDTGVAAVALHGRTQQQHYSGEADWDAIAELKSLLSIPVFGNGDVFSGADAQKMLDHTGVDAIVVGRGAQGRPWIFHDIVAALTGANKPEAAPTLKEVAEVIVKHAELMIEYSRSEEDAMRNMRKHIGWYLRGFSIGGQQRLTLQRVNTLSELVGQLQSLDLQQPYPQAARGRRGRAGKPKKTHLPAGWLDSRTLSTAGRRDVALNETHADGG